MRPKLTMSTQAHSVVAPSPRAQWIAGTIVVLYALLTMVPLAWIFLTAFKSGPDSISYPPKLVFTPSAEGFCNLFNTRSRQTDEYLASLLEQHRWIAPTAYAHPAALTPAWLLGADRIRLDRQANEGVAEGAVLRFYGVPILGAPVLSFPLTDERKSGWLPPSINLDSKSGLQFSIPWYWNIAPNRDATLTPMVSAKRGFGGEAEFRYLEPDFQGKANVHLLPNDRLTGQARHALNLSHEGALPLGASVEIELLVEVR